MLYTFTLYDFRLILLLLEFRGRWSFIKLLFDSDLTNWPLLLLSLLVFICCGWFLLLLREFLLFE